MQKYSRRAKRECGREGYIPRWEMGNTVLAAARCAGACKYSQIRMYLASGQTHFKYIRGLQHRTRFKYSQMHMYLISGQIR